VAKLKCSRNSREFSPEQNDAGLNSVSQTAQTLAYSIFQMLVVINSRWRPAVKLAEFVDVALQIDLGLYGQEVYLCQRDVCSICSFVYLG
jgi:hypothetical protein